ncbi:MAG TPA: SIR2 family protein [Candidatus Binataceae bacterium]|nr:SIR2 family protein [Candidatus Binataceae bacterium]
MSDQIARAYNDHNVYILGAGFAQEAGLPLIKDFMNRMRDAATWLEEQGGREGELKAISRVLDFRLKAAAAAHRVPLNVENVEDLFSLASASGDQDLAKAMPLAIAATLDHARSVAPALADHQYFPIGVLNVPGWTKPANWKPPTANIQEGVRSGQLKGDWYGCPPYDFYLGVMCSYFNRGGPERRDTIITFNYDTLVEEVFHGLEIAFNYGLPEGSVEFHDSAGRMKGSYSNAKISILKLHGSLNWWALPPEEQERLRRRVYDARVRTLQDEGRLAEQNLDELTRSGLRLGHLTVYGCPGARPAIPFLAPPTWRKDFSGYFGDIWHAAVLALRTATNVVILGYSVPPTDQHFKYLLSAGLQDNISLRKVFFVNRGLAQEETKRQLEERLFGLFRRELFDQDIISLIPTDIREYLAGPRIMGGESDRVLIGRPLNPPGYTWGTAPWTVFPPFQSGWSIA